MKDITIKNIPDEIEDEVREHVARTVENYYRKTELEPTKSKKETFESKVDAFRQENSLEKKFKRVNNFETNVKK